MIRIATVLLLVFSLVLTGCGWWKSKRPARGTVVTDCQGGKSWVHCETRRY